MENGIFEIFINIRMAGPYPFGIYKNFKYPLPKNTN